MAKTERGSKRATKASGASRTAETRRRRRGDGAARTEAPLTATEEAEAQLAALHGEAGSPFAPLPRHVAGAPPGARPIPTDDSRRFLERDLREEEAPFGFGIPASEEAALGGKREPFERQRGAFHHERSREGRLSPMVRRMVRAFPPLFRAVGNVARAIDRPVRDALAALDRLGREARRAG